MKCEACGGEGVIKCYCRKCLKWFRLCLECFDKWNQKNDGVCHSCRGVENKKEEVMETKALETVLKKIEDVEVGDEVVNDYGENCYKLVKIVSKKKVKATAEDRPSDDYYKFGDGFSVILSGYGGTYVMVVKR